MMVLAAIVVGSSLDFLTSKMFLGLTGLSDCCVLRYRVHDIPPCESTGLERERPVINGRSIILGFGYRSCGEGRWMDRTDRAEQSNWVISSGRAVVTFEGTMSTTMFWKIIVYNK